MDRRAKINIRAQQNAETGLGVNSSDNAERFFDKNGDPHIRIRGNSLLKRISIYQSMLKMPVWKFFLTIVAGYFLVNLVFATVYFFIGIENFGGIDTASMQGKFLEAFFFSTQTLTTVGYGHVYPVGTTSNTIAAIESLFGWLMFALATGLMYGRFAKPKAFILFSHNAIFAPFKDGVALMFRMAPYKKHYLTDVETKVTVSIRTIEAGIEKNQFFNLKLDISKANTLTLNWTLVHVLDENSPFYGLSNEEIVELQPELLVFVKGYDDEYSNLVIARTSYTFREFIFGAKFKPMYYAGPDKRYTIMDLGKINEFDQADLPKRSYSQNLTG